jgi:hypothetical protein
MTGRTNVTSTVGRLLLIGASAVPLSGCFTSTADFRRDAENYISNAVAEAVGTTFQDVTCVEPTSQSIGTRFTCSAIDADGAVWEFDNVIDAENEFTVNVSRRP